MKNLITSIMLVFILSTVSCVSTQGNGQRPQTSNAVKYGAGAGILGGIAHAIIGGDTQQGLAIVGGSILGGYLLGNEKDKRTQQSNYQTQRRDNSYNYTSSRRQRERQRHQQMYNTSYNQRSQQDEYDDGFPKTKWRKNIKRVTKDGVTTETITETGVSTMTEDVYYE
jgi:hypothetical protein